ncbi:hypothetical protein JCM10212_001781 [Sporobolomyces blumeae]
MPNLSDEDALPIRSVARHRLDRLRSEHHGRLVERLEELPEGSEPGYNIFYTHELADTISSWEYRKERARTSHFEEDRNVTHSIRRCVESAKTFLWTVQRSKPERSVHRYWRARFVLHDDELASPAPAGKALNWTSAGYLTFERCTFDGKPLGTSTSTLSSGSPGGLPIIPTIEAGWKRPTPAGQDEYYLDRWRRFAPSVTMSVDEPKASAFYNVHWFLSGASTSHGGSGSRGSVNHRQPARLDMAHGPHRSSLVPVLVSSMPPVPLDSSPSPVSSSSISATTML